MYKHVVVPQEADVIPKRWFHQKSGEVKIDLSSQKYTFVVRGLQKLFHDLGRGARVLQFINWQTGTTCGRMTRNIVQVSEPWKLEVSAFHGHNGNLH